MKAAAVQRKCDSCPEDEPRVQRRVAGAARAAEAETRTASDSRFVHDFTDVRASAEASAEGGAADRAANDSADAAPQRWIVDDREVPAPGQMRRREFLDELHAAICATSETEMARLGRSTAGCPLLDKWQSFSRNKSAAQLESSARRYAAEAENVRSAREYIPIVTRRIRQSIGQWGRSGQVPDLPPDLAAEFGLGKIKVGVGSLLSGLAGGLVGGLFGSRKAADDTTGGGNATPWLTARGGRPLDSGVASQMSDAFGRSFSDVRVHSDPEGASTASAAGARALTVGSDIAFAAGEYRPGTLVGDALLAHELAHVAQQQGASGPMLKSDDASTSSLESDADDAAVHAVVSKWGRTRQFARELGQRSGPRLKSGLRLQRCSETLPAKRESLEKQSLETSTPACPPSVGRLKMYIDGEPSLLPDGDGCAFQLGHAKEGLAEGMQIHGSITSAPNCAGNVHFVQYVRRQHTVTDCGRNGPEGLCAVSSGFGIDSTVKSATGGSWVYENATNLDLSRQPGSQKVWMGDVPGMRNISGSTFTRVCFNDSFVTYLVYQPPAGAPVSLGWMSWEMVATALRNKGNCPADTKPGCEGWELAGSSYAKQTAEDVRPGATHPSVPLDPKAEMSIGSVGFAPCDANSCAKGGK